MICNCHAKLSKFDLDLDGTSSLNSIIKLCHSENYADGLKYSCIKIEKNIQVNDKLYPKTRQLGMLDKMPKVKEGHSFYSMLQLP